ncbi:hypothetical protein KA089_02290 [Candidatus Woesebacteria bacterium]|nr:hypothetical protein [Candidatus Woesebacteria bacterium]
MAETENTGVTLTQMTHFSRQAVKYGSIALAVMMVGRIVVTGFIAYWKATHPAPPPPPTVGFGKLPTLRFDERSEEQKPSSYKLETANGSTPDFGDRAKVYFMPKAAANLLADQSAKDLASKYGFVFEPEVLGTETYRWTKSKPIASNLEMNIRNLNFKFTTNYLSHPEYLVNAQAPDGRDAIDRVKKYLKKIDLLPEDIASASAEVVYLKSLGGELAPAASQSDADFIQVDLDRLPVDKEFKMYSPEGYKASIRAILTGALDGEASIVEFEMNHNDVDYEQVETYPLRTSRSAWQLLQAGEGYIASKGKSDQAVIRKVTLGYYDDFEEQEYLQPIYIFENEGDGFLGYVSALDPKYIQK